MKGRGGNSTEAGYSRNSPERLVAPEPRHLPGKDLVQAYSLWRCAGPGYGGGGEWRRLWREAFGKGGVHYSHFVSDQELYVTGLIQCIFSTFAHTMT